MSDQQTKQDISPTIPAKNIIKEIAFGFVNSEGEEQVKQFEMGADAKYIYLKRTKDSKESCNSLQNKIDVYNKVFNENELTTLGLAKGKNSMAEGNCSYAEGNYSHAEGSNTQAIGNSSHAEGVGTVATGVGSHTEGHNTEASNQDAHAEGYTSIASGYASHAEGTYFGTLDADDMQRTVASGAGSHAEGVGTQAKEGASHSEGARTVAGGEASHAEGSSTQALAKYSHTEGVLTTVNANATGGHAEGRETIAGDEAAHAEGYGAQALGYISHAEGWNTIAEAQGSHTEGLRTIAKGKYQHVQGKYNEEDTVDTSGYGKYSHIVGGGSSAERKNIHTLDWDGNAWYQGDVQAKKNLKADEDAEIGNNLNVTKNTTTESLNVGTDAVIGNSISLGRKTNSTIGVASVAEGIEVIASKTGSHAEGYKTEATGEYAHAEGFSDENSLGLKATGKGSHAEGYSTRATEEAAHSEGKNTLADGVGAHAEGEESYAQADCAHAEGWKTEANKKGSHAEGNQTKAEGLYSHAEGGATTINGNPVYTIAQGEASHAEGIATQAFNIGSHTEGFYTKANKDFQHVQGKWNVEDNTKVHIVGWGDETQRKNIHTLDEQGNAWFAGNISAGKENENSEIKGNLIVDGKITAKLGLVNESGSEDFKTENLQVDNKISLGEGHLIEHQQEENKSDFIKIETPINLDVSQWWICSLREDKKEFPDGFQNSDYYPNTLYFMYNGSPTAYEYANKIISKLEEDVFYEGYVNTPSTPIRIVLKRIGSIDFIMNGFYTTDYVLNAPIIIENKWGVEEGIKEIPYLGLLITGQYGKKTADDNFVHVVGGGTSEDDRKNIYTLDESGNSYFSGSIATGDGNNFDINFKKTSWNSYNHTFSITSFKVVKEEYRTNGFEDFEIVFEKLGIMPDFNEYKYKTTIIGGYFTSNDGGEYTEKYLFGDISYLFNHPDLNKPSPKSISNVIILHRDVANPIIFSTSPLSALDHPTYIDNITFKTTYQIPFIDNSVTKKGFFISGQYADFSPQYVHIIGGGGYDSLRKNIYTLDWDGNAEFAGDIKFMDSKKNQVSIQALLDRIIALENQLKS